MTNSHFYTFLYNSLCMYVNQRLLNLAFNFSLTTFSQIELKFCILVSVIIQFNKFNIIVNSRWLPGQNGGSHIFIQPSQYGQETTVHYVQFQMSIFHLEDLEILGNVKIAYKCLLKKDVFPKNCLDCEVFGTAQNKHIL